MSIFNYNHVLLLLGIAILAVAWLPSLLEKYPLSYPILFVALGTGAYSIPALGLPDPSPLHHSSLATHLIELCVIVALTGTGLKIDRAFSFRKWRIPLLLIVVLMVITVVSVALAAWWLLAVAPATAMLVAGVLAPTDPVLAGDVQVGDPGEGREDNVRFALTAEAGLNDGFAFPFIYLALALLPAAIPLSERLVHWLWFDVAYRVIVGSLSGWLAGKLLGYLIFKLPKRLKLKASAYGFVALAVTLCTYGLTEMAHGYGFLAVFVAAITLRGREKVHEYHHQMHAFTDQLERLLIVITLVLFGGNIAQGLLSTLTWQQVALALLLLLVIRPLGSMLTLVGSRITMPERWAISFFGIRGIGSFFYLAFALEKGRFQQPEQLLTLTGFVVLLSVVLHGVLATPVMTWLDRRAGRA
ncbi:cation:proton antiporter [Hymenobacter aerilatus]|uniref:Cation:proton antiporter n=1 Tax=Hymenobacter aerilatus TaxID=2932251 RepID=A0A8T9T320_9BACT|nr:cation:proton antiporter [Hymenobacter aerilatus]UOR07564.1 cation:proton antiporter [Hymenobacter aerilatus]